MSIPGIQVQFLQVTVVRGDKLKDTEWITRQDPYVSLDYGGSGFHTKRCKDGGKNPVFNEHFVFPLIEGVRELKISVHNSNRLRADDFIGSGSVQLHNFLSKGYDAATWPIYTEHGELSGEIQLILQFPNANVGYPQTSNDVLIPKKKHKSHLFKLKHHSSGGPSSHSDGSSSHSESDREEEAQEILMVAEEVEEKEEVKESDYSSFLEEAVINYDSIDHFE